VTPPARFRWSKLLLVACLGLAAIRVAATWEVLSETYDEGVHLAAGMELLDRGTYNYEAHHPPLARLAMAIGPYLDGVRSQGMPDKWAEGRALIHVQNPLRTLSLARLGILPFLLLAIVMVWMWTRRLAGEGAATVAAALFSSSPLVLAHGGLATTDMPVTATMLAFVYAATRWLEAPTRLHAWCTGLLAGATIATKFSAIPFLAVTGVLVGGGMLWFRRGTASPAWSRGHTRSLALVMSAALLALWAGFGFSVRLEGGLPLPAAGMIRGLGELAEHNRLGHASYLLGAPDVDGDWRFFPVGLAVKTPLTLLLAGVAGAATAVRESWRRADWRWMVPVALGTAVLAVSVPARIHVGVRHVLVVQAVLAVGAGIAVASAWDRWRAWAARGMLVVAGAAGLWATVRAHPDYLPWFNELGGQHPERILVDSDLDWGQDLWRLRDALRRRGIDSVTTAYFGSANPAMYGVPVRARWRRGQPVDGWFVVSVTLKERGDAVLQNGEWTVYPDALSWLDALEPVERVGKTLLLYHVSTSGSGTGR
jgi:hypothetical protein